MTMTTIDDTDTPSVRPLTSEPPWRFSWGAILAGSAIALGLGLLLYALGFGIGLTSIEPNEADPLGALGAVTGIWSLLIPLLALFGAGFAAAKVAGPITRMGGAIHGVVVWAISTLLAALLIFSAVSSMIGGAARIGNAAVSAAGAAISAVPTGILPSDLLSRAGFSMNDLVPVVNARLGAQGKPNITADGLGAALQDALTTSIRQGRIDQQIFVNALAQHTALSQADARDLANTLTQGFNNQTSALAQQLQQFGNAAETTLLQAAEATGKTMLWLFLSMLLGLGGGIAGTLVGLTRAQRAVAERVTARAERLVRRPA